MHYQANMKRALSLLLLAALSLTLAVNARAADFQKRAARRSRKSAPARRVAKPAGVNPQPAKGAATEQPKQGDEQGEQQRQVSTSDTSTLGMTPDEALAVAIREALRRPRAGETRALGLLELIECGPKNDAVFRVRVGEKTLKLDGGDLQGVHFTAFTPRETGSEVSCGPRRLDHPVVVTYRADAKEGGALVAVEFVPKGFTLDK